MATKDRNLRTKSDKIRAFRSIEYKKKSEEKRKIQKISKISFMCMFLFVRILTSYSHPHMQNSSL